MLLDNEEYKKKNYQKALEEVFVELDYLLLSEEGNDKMRTILIQMKQAIRGPGAKLDPMEEKEIKSIPFNAGCTSCVCLVTKDSVYCSNSGDSRAIIVSKSGKVTELSYDHKPDNDGEMRRIKAAGGYVEDGRVQGIIAVSRAIGDWEYKNPKLLEQLEKKRPLKKKKSEALTSSTSVTGGPYRNIEEAKKH